MEAENPRESHEGRESRRARTGRGDLRGDFATPRTDRPLAAAAIPSADELASGLVFIPTALNVLPMGSSTKNVGSAVEPRDRPCPRAAGASAGARPAARGNDTRSRLLAAAIELLLAEGIHALSQPRVAAAAGLRQSHLTYYFPTRVDLLKAVVEFADESIIGMVEGKPEAMPRSLAQLRDLLCKPVLGGRMPRLMLAMHAAAEEDPELHEWMRGFDQRMRARVQSILEQLGIKPGPRDFSLFHASMIGIAVQCAWRHDESFAREARALLHAAVDRLVDGAAPRGRTGSQA